MKVSDTRKHSFALWTLMFLHAAQHRAAGQERVRVQLGADAGRPPRQALGSSISFVVSAKSPKFCEEKTTSKQLDGSPLRQL